MDSDLPLSGRSRRIAKYDGFWTSVQNRLNICSDYVATQFGRSRSIVKHNGFWTSKQNRCSRPCDPDSLHVGSRHRSGKKMVVGNLLVDVGFASARVRIHWKTQWIMASDSDSIVFYRAPWLHHGDLQNTTDSGAVARIRCVFNGSWTRLLATSILVFKPTFCVFKELLNVWSGSLSFGRERRMSHRICTSRRSFFGIFQISLHLSAEMADLQNVDYLSMFPHVLASIVIGIL